MTEENKAGDDDEPKIEEEQKINGNKDEEEKGD